MNARRILLAAALPLTGIAALLIGSTDLSLADLWRGLSGASDTAARDALRTLLDFRLPVVLQAAAVGGLLAVCGAALQALLQNPLAEPYILGTSSGAALGISLAGTLGLAPFFWPRTLLAFVGGLLASAVVLGAGWRRGRAMSPLSLILAGVVTGSFLSAATVALQSLLTPFEFRNTVGLLLGGFRALPWNELLPALLPALLVVALLVARSTRLDILSTGIDSARAVGMAANRELVLVVGLVSLATAIAVSLAGIIGFVGLVAPHVVRMTYGGRHARLLPRAFVVGAAFTVFADMLARALSAYGQLPAGAITAFLGAPVFIMILRRQGGSHG